MALKTSYTFLYAGNGQSTQLMTIMIMIIQSKKQKLSARDKQSVRSHTFGLNDLRQCFRQLYYHKLSDHKSLKENEAQKQYERKEHRTGAFRQ
jgi:hypothetical protein